MIERRVEDVRAELRISEPPSYEPIPPTGEAPKPIDLVRALLSRDPIAKIVANRAPPPPWAALPNGRRELTGRHPRG